MNMLLSITYRVVEVSNAHRGHIRQSDALIIEPCYTVTSSYPLADAGGLSLIIPVALYAQIYHHSIPVLAEPVRDKTLLKKIFLAAFVLMGAFYVFLGVSLPLYFGKEINSQVSDVFATFCTVGMIFDAYTCRST